MVEKQELAESAAEMPTECHACGEPGFVRMCVSSVPYFKEIIIMAFRCDHCGFKNNEVKQGGGISPKGARITLTVERASDLDRDIFKSESAEVIIPEIDLVLSQGTLGS